MSQALRAVAHKGPEGARRMGALIEMGLEPYDAVRDLQLRMVELRQQNEIPDTLLLLEHEPVITLGRRGEREHILADEATLCRERIQVHRVERGGDVAYHGPGQLVGYPIMVLADHGLGISDYMHCLEEVMIRVCADYGIIALRREKVIGVWVEENKIAALGVRVRRGVTFHGFALNVSPTMRHFELIIPCGITDGGVTSIAQELNDSPSMLEARARVVARFTDVFGLEMYDLRLTEGHQGHTLDPRTLFR